MLMKVLTAKKKHYSRKRFNDFLRLFKSLSLRQRNPVRMLVLTGFFFALSRF